MDFLTCFQSQRAFLMEGALGERLKQEYHIAFDSNVVMAGLVESEAREALAVLWSGYLEIAAARGLPFLATTPTRRANRERIAASRFDASVIRHNVTFLRQFREKKKALMYIGGLMGCRGDAYRADDVLSVDAAEDFHFWQADLLREAGADFLYAGIMPALPEAVGMARAMGRTGLPYIISFMIRRDGRLLDGATIHDAITAVDARANPQPVCYMTNCVHPDVLYDALCQPFNRTARVRARFLGIQANTSPLPPEALEKTGDLKCADALTLAESIRRLWDVMDVKIYGGCCGTDESHMAAMAELCTQAP